MKSVVFSFRKRAKWFALFMLGGSICFLNQANAQNSGYVAGDFHQHSTYTDGSYSIDTVMKSNAHYGLQWWANSEHGGGFNRDGRFSGLNLGNATIFWDSYNPIPILGTISMSSGHQNMWRWQSIRDNSFQDVLNTRVLFPGKTIFQALEWNVPGHEHCSMGIINNQYETNPNANPVAEFEFKFDANDADQTGGTAQGWTKSTNGNNHTKTLEAISWVQANYPNTAWMVPAHPERKSLYNIAAFRDMNNAGPTVCFGFESMGGHQKSADRGEYKRSYNTDGITTYGGCGIYAARVGGLWDALLSEGRAWWLFASSDFHNDQGADFWPGEYQKTYTYVPDRNNPQAYVDGLRSGNSYVVNGDLIDSLLFEIVPMNTNGVMATMGQTLPLCGKTKVLHIKVRDPQGVNHNIYSGYNNPVLNHIDLISGRVKGKIQPADPNYNIPSISTTNVIARFDATGGITDNNGLTSKSWIDLGNGWKEMTFILNNYSDTMYYRLRGTNLGLNIANETDANGNPLSDSLMYPNNASKAFADLWFYTNPVFVASNINDSTATASFTQNQSVLGNSKICVASDLHLMDPSLLINDGVAFQTYLSHDRKLIKESDAIMQKLASIIYNERPEIFLVPGDLTKDGEKISHQKLAQYLANIESNGVTKVFVVPGNHDVNNVHAYSYDGNLQIKVDSVSPVDFKAIYNQFGYAEASKTDTASLSYLAKPKQKLWVLAIDACSYDSNMVANEPVTEGKFKLSTYKWVLDRLKEARDSGAVVLGMMHHGVTEHYTGQSIAFSEYVVNGWDTISKNFANAGLKMMFTGHYHANDITKRSLPGNASFIYDIETGSAVTWPCPYRVMQLNGDSILNVTTNHITNINFNTNGLPFQDYAHNFLTQGLTGIVNYQLQHPPYSLDAATTNAVTPHIVSAFEAHYNGDETIPASEQGFLSYLNSVGQTVLSSTIASLRTDLAPMDNNVDIPLRNAVDSMLMIVNNFNQTDYTVPSWTLFLKAKKTLQTNRDSSSIASMNMIISKMKSSSMPYNITININKDPKTRLGFNWFTNAGVTGGKVQIVQGVASNASVFNNPLIEITARCDSAKNLNYNVSANNLSTLAGIANNTKKSYMFNKAIATGLTPNTVYSYRVGKNGAWSEIGSFKTAVAGKETFSFIYTTDPQANTDEMFGISQKTTHAANSLYPNANFWLHCGDLVETSGSSNSEWEWEQLFETQQDIFLNKPFAPIQGNHDISVNKNFTYHFNTDSVAFDYAKATTPGSVYSYVYGDALFMAMTYENYSTAGYLDSLAVWMSNQVKANPEAKWRIAYYHKTMYTGSGSHQSDNDGKTVRLKMGPVFDSLKIDLALQGHDHIYEIIGPVKNIALISGAVSNQQIVTATPRENVTGLLGGTFDSKRGTIFFLNNSAGKKKYEPRNQAQMAAVEAGVGISNYFSMFTGRFGQTGEPTFSNVEVSSDTIIISTYTVNDQGTASLFDSFKIIKNTQDNNWTGSVSSNWNNVANWSEGVIPTQSQKVIINKEASRMPVIGEAAICKDITIEEGGSLLGNTNLSIKGEATAICKITPDAWHLMSSSVNGAKANAFYNNDMPQVYVQMFNSNGDWTGITNGNQMLINGKAYSAWAVNDTATVTFKNNAFNYGSVSTPVLMNTGLLNGYGFNLIGNPYPSAIDADVAWSLGLPNISSSFYTWNQQNHQYSTYNAATGIGQLGATAIIPANQGFFIDAISNGNFTFNESWRKHDATPLIKSSPANTLRLNVSGNNLSDEAIITFNSNATNGYDVMYDSRKMKGSTDAPQLYTIADNENLAINVMSESTSNQAVSIPMNFEAGNNGSFILTASELNSFVLQNSIYLIDHKLNQTINLNQNPVYTFNAQIQDSHDRFSILFGSANSVNEIQQSSIIVYVNNNTLHILNNDTETVRGIQILNMLGQVVKESVSANTLMLNMESAYYIVKVITSGKTYTQKVFIK